MDIRGWANQNDPSVTLTIFFSSLGLEFLGVFNIASVVYHLRPGHEEVVLISVASSPLLNLKRPDVRNIDLIFEFGALKLNK